MLLRWAAMYWQPFENVLGISPRGRSKNLVRLTALRHLGIIAFLRIPSVFRLDLAGNSPNTDNSMRNV